MSTKYIHKVVYVCVHKCVRVCGGYMLSNSNFKRGHDFEMKVGECESLEFREKWVETLYGHI